MPRFERLRERVAYVAITLCGLGLLAALDRQLVRADVADARARREIIATEVLHQVVSETDQDIQLMRTTASFVRANDTVTPAEFTSFVREIREEANGLRWMALRPVGDGPVLIYPPGPLPADWPQALPAYRADIREPWPISENLRILPVRDRQDRHLWLIADIDFSTIGRLASRQDPMGLYSISAAHSLNPDGHQTSLTDHGDTTVSSLQAGNDRWQVTIHSLKPRGLLLRGRQSLWGVGLTAIALALYGWRTRQRLWDELRRRVKRATQSLASQNAFLFGLTGLLSRPMTETELAQAVTRLLMEHLPVTAPNLWLSEHHGQGLLSTAAAEHSVAPDAAIVASWLQESAADDAVLAIPIRSEARLFGILAVTSPVPLSSSDHEILLFVAHHIGLAIDARRLAGAIDRERRLAEAILGSLSEAVLVCGANGRIRFANAAAPQLFGLTDVQDLLQRPTGTLSLNPNPCTLDETLVTNGVAWLRHGSRRLPIRYNRAPLGQGSSVVTLRDISAEESAAAQKAEFIALASHELRTPLAIIRAQSQALTMADTLQLSAERQTEMRASIIQQVDRLTKLVHDLLDASALTAASVVFHRGPHDLATIIESALRPLAGKARQKQQPLTVTIAPDLPNVLTDPELSVAILANLIDNAINYSEAGRPIRIAAHRADDESVTVDVTDEGIGIAAEDIETMFQPFHRLRTPFYYQVRGTGLGLYLAREWAKATGATVTVTSQPGQGSTFSLHLPVAERIAHRPPAA